MRMQPQRALAPAGGVSRAPRAPVARLRSSAAGDLDARWTLATPTQHSEGASRRYVWAALPGLVGRRARRSARCAAKPASRFFDEPETAAPGKLWGQDGKRDVLREPEPGELIWNTDWETSLDRSLPRGEDAVVEAAPSSPPSPSGSGFLSLARVSALDDPRVGLESASLRSAGAPRAAAELAEALLPLEDALRSGAGPGAPRPAPTRGERRRWSSDAKFSTGSSRTEAAASKQGEPETEAQRAASLATYASLKQELATITAASAAFLALLTSWLYGAETGASYALGAAGGLLYLRLLSRSVDAASPGGTSARDVVETTLGGQRLLIPALLVAGWNRWNALGAPLTGFHLEVAPILAGFFSYKIGSVVQLVRDLKPSKN